VRDCYVNGVKEVSFSSFSISVLLTALYLFGGSG
jgi:hypothetical protein